MLVPALAISLLAALGWANERFAQNDRKLPLAFEENLGQTDDLLSADAQSSWVSAAPAATMPEQTATLDRPAEIPPGAWQRMMDTIAEDQRRSSYAVRPVSEAEGVTEAGGAPSGTQRDVLFRSHSPERGLQARYGSVAPLLSRDEATREAIGEHGTWELSLPLAAWGRPGAMTPAAPATLEAEANRLSYARPGIEEWYLTDERGIEQGFTIDARPAGAGDLRVEMRLPSRLEVELDADGLGASFMDGSGELALRYAGLAAWDAEGRALDAKLAMGEAAQRLAIVVDNAGAAYPVTIDPLFDPPDLELKLTASDGQASDLFGNSVAISGDTAIVGVPFEDEKGNAAGAAYIFERNEGGADNWGEVTKLTASDAQGLDQFGRPVSISGDTAIVGAREEDEKGSNAGAAYIFERDEGGADNWGEVTKLTASDAQAFDRFGLGVSISGDTAIVGAVREDEKGSDAGAAYIFERDEGGADN